jgi:6-phosphogluconate dehydrogenase
VMGRNLALNIEEHGFPVAVWNLETDVVDQFTAENRGKKFVGTKTFADFVKALERPRRIMMMIKAGSPVDQTIDKLAPFLEEGDVVIDGGNSWFKDTQERTKRLESKRLHFVGSGVSGGEEGARFGPSLMPGGSNESWKAIQPVFEAIAAKSDSGPCVTHVGPDGAGHFVKMVHNGIEYGLMAAYAEGLNVLRHANAGSDGRDIDAETAPLRDPEAYQYDIDVGEVAEVWRRGSVVASWLLDLTASALAKSSSLDDFSGRVSDSGEGRWTVLAAVDTGVPAPVLTTALYERFESRGEADYADKILSAMRKEFGGHAERPTGA